MKIDHSGIAQLKSQLGSQNFDDPCLDLDLSIARQAIECLYSDSSSELIDNLVCCSKSELDVMEKIHLQNILSAVVTQHPHKEHESVVTSYQIAVPLVFLAPKSHIEQVMCSVMSEKLIEELQRAFAEFTGIQRKDVLVNRHLLSRSDVAIEPSRQIILPAISNVKKEISSSCETIFENSTDLDSNNKYSERYIWINIIDRELPFSSFDFCNRLYYGLLSDWDSLALRLKLEAEFQKEYQPYNPNLAIFAGHPDIIDNAIANAEGVVREANLIKFLVQEELLEDAASQTVVINHCPETNRIAVKLFEDNYVSFVFNYGEPCFIAVNDSNIELDCYDVHFLKARLARLGFENFIITNKTYMPSQKVVDEDQLISIA